MAGALVALAGVQLATAQALARFWETRYDWRAFEAKLNARCRSSAPGTARCADLFNVANEVLLHTLQRYFAHIEETDEQLSTPARAAATGQPDAMASSGGSPNPS